MRHSRERRAEWPGKWPDKALPTILAMHTVQVVATCRFVDIDVGPTLHERPKSEERQALDAGLNGVAD